MGQRGFVAVDRQGWRTATEGLSVCARALLAEFLIAADHRAHVIEGTTVTEWADALGTTWRAVRAALDELSARDLVAAPVVRGHQFVVTVLCAPQVVRAKSQERDVDDPAGSRDIARAAPAETTERPAETASTRARADNPPPPSRQLAFPNPGSEEEEVENDGRVGEALDLYAQQEYRERAPLSSPVRIRAWLAACRRNNADRLEPQLGALAIANPSADAATLLSWVLHDPGDDYLFAGAPGRRTDGPEREAAALGASWARHATPELRASIEDRYGHDPALLRVALDAYEGALV